MVEMFCCGRCVERHIFSSRVEASGCLSQTTCQHAKPSSFSSRTFYRRCFEKAHQKSFPLCDNGGYSHRSKFESWERKRVWSACAHEDSFLMCTSICARFWVARFKKIRDFGGLLRTDHLPTCQAFIFSVENLLASVFVEGPPRSVPTLP